jgi:hypothetical protein
VNAIGKHSPDLIGFIGYEWNFQDHAGKDTARLRQLMMSMFSNINIFHGNALYFQTRDPGLMQLVWWMVYSLVLIGSIILIKTSTWKMYGL